MVVRGDCGTENCIVAQIQIAFRMNHDDDQSKEKSFIYGPSTANIVSSTGDIVVIIISLLYLCSELRLSGLSGDGLVVIGG